MTEKQRNREKPKDKETERDKYSPIDLEIYRNVERQRERARREQGNCELYTCGDNSNSRRYGEFKRRRRWRNIDVKSHH